MSRKGKYLITRASLQALINQKFGKRYEIGYIHHRCGWFALDSKAEVPAKYLGRNKHEAYAYLANHPGDRFMHKIKEFLEEITA